MLCVAYYHVYMSFFCSVDFLVTFCSSDTLSVFFFFFQAEDGIRDGRVTGVQTCALPIFLQHRRPAVAYDHKASMLQDVEARRKTEIDFLNGGIVRFGDEHGVPTPHKNRKSGVEGKRGEIGGRRIIKKKKRKKEGGAMQKR